MTSRELAFTADTGADRSNTDARPRMASLRLGGISRERERIQEHKRCGKSPGVGWRQKDNREWMQRERENRSNASHSLQEKRREEVD